MTSKIKVDNIEDASGNAMVSKCGTTVTLGKTGDTIQLATGASQTGFGRTGTVDWDTTKKTSAFTAVSGNGYFVDTSSSAITVTLPASPSAGDIVSISDYARNFGTNAVTIARNGSNIGGGAFDAVLDTNSQTVTFVYVDSTKGWINTQQATDTVKGANPYIVATGGTITTCGNFKIHTFTSPGTFTITSAGTPAGANTMDYLVVGGGGTGGGDNGGGGGAGGVRFSCGTFTLPSPAPASPRGCVASLSTAEQAYPVTVGAGGSYTPSPSFGTKGSDSIFSTITSAGGGGGGTDGGSLSPGIGDGGSGGGAGQNSGSNGPVSGSGNTPPVSPAQGSNGGTAPGPTTSGGAGGGGFIGTGVPSPTGDANGGAGGAGGGFPTAFGCNGSPSGCFQYYGGGGGGGTGQPSSGSGGSAGLGGGGAGGPNGNAGSSATANTGGGGGGGGQGSGAGNGGSGIVVIRYQFQSS